MPLPALSILTVFGDTSKAISPDAIDALVSKGHLPADFATAYALFARLLVMVRLVAPDCATPPEAAQVLIAGSLGFADWDGLMAAIRDYRGVVMHEWQRLFGPRDF